jgi:hypothetical protein
VSEATRLARAAAQTLLKELDVQDEPSSIENAMTFCHLEQHVLPEQLELPYDAPPDVRGILDLGGMNVFVKGSRPPRIRWVSAHEIGHYAIPEHNELLRFCSTFDLSAEARRQLEIEANVFAAEFLFQGGRFSEACTSQGFSISMLRSMSDGFGVSYEAGFRRFVEENPKPVAMLVSHPMAPVSENLDGRVVVNFGARPTRLRYGTYSQSFRQQFGLAVVRQVFETDHPISRATESGQSTGEIVFRNQTLTVESFYNQYDVLSIVRPAGTAA